MKQSATFALSALFALAAAVPLERREYTSTIIEDVTETVDVYTTVYVSPGDPRLTSQQVATRSPSSAAMISVTPLASTSAVQPSTPPQTTSQVPVVLPQQNMEAQVQASAPTSTPVPSITPQAPAQPEVKAAAPVAPAAPVAQGQSSPAPVPSQSPPSGSTSDSGSSGGTCGQKHGKCTAESVTTFDGGLGSCGYDDGANTKSYFALAHGMMGEQSNGNPNCGRTAKIVYNGQSFDATLTDKCMGCEGASIDLSKDLFNQIFPTAGGTGRFHNVEWYFTS